MFLQATMDSKYLLLSGTQHVIEAKFTGLLDSIQGNFLSVMILPSQILNEELRKDTAKASVMGKIALE